MHAHFPPGLATLTPVARIEDLLARLAARKGEWAGLAVGERIALLRRVRARVAEVAPRWIQLSNRAKGIAADSPLEGEEWTCGPWALLAGCDQVLATLVQIAERGAPDLGALPRRRLPGGQLAVGVFPLKLMDRLLLNGVSAEVWMQPGVTDANLAQHTAVAYRDGHAARPELALVLGAGNIASIAPLDAIHKLFTDKAVTLVKLNPVNDYLLPVFEHIFAPMIARDFVHFVAGGADVGAWLCTHDRVDSLHVTGSQATHDRIVFGPGALGDANRAADRPVNPRPITSELGAVCPTIVVPGPWSRADIAFQAAHIATQKLHNSGFNCVACQVLVLPEQWDRGDALRHAVRKALAAAPDRPPYYPGAADRQADLRERQGGATRINRGDALAARELVTLPPPAIGSGYGRTEEVFAPTLCEQLLPGDDAEAFLRNAIAYCNEHLRGTLGASVLIHPATRKALGPTFELLLKDLRYGCIGVNAWAGLGFLISTAPWGAFPGHRRNDVQSGIGTVHNAFMFARPERAVVSAPFRPFPRSLVGGSAPALLPKPPWFVDHRRAHRVGRKLLAFQRAPGWLKLPGIFLDALRG